MKERPIFMSAPMVCATLNGDKTQTRRVVKLPTSHRVPVRGVRGGVKLAIPQDGWAPMVIEGGYLDKACTIPNPNPPEAAIWQTKTGVCIACPYGQVGDRLWVRETFCAGVSATHGGGGLIPVRFLSAIPMERRKAVYRAMADYGADQPPWRPSIHMPRWASRITLEITGIRVERVQEIREADALTEGVKFFPRDEFDAAGYAVERNGNRELTAKDVYAGLWDSLNAKRGYSWESNPWVWIIEFKLLETPAQCEARREKVMPGYAKKLEDWLS